VAINCKTRHFSRWAVKSGISDNTLAGAIKEIQAGLIDADLGGGIIKKRIALPGRGKRGSTRTLLATNKKDRWIFVFGFEKNERDNITTNELEALRFLSADLLRLSDKQVNEAIRHGALVEVKDETKDT
jgi:hypothetical protein